MRNKPTNLHLSDKLDIIDARLDDVEKVLVLQEANLKEHMKRTELLEDAVNPLNKFMYAAMGIISFITFISVVVGIYVAVK